MAELRPFRGIRYDLGRAGPLADLIAPPYDVINPQQQQRLYDRSDYNAIRLELTQDEAGDDEKVNRYTRAAAALSNWLTEGILVQDSARHLYVYEQEFNVEGHTFRRRGFLGRVRLEPFGSGKIFPHEETMSGPKADRLKLYHATNMNVSPIFGLYPDPDNAVVAPLDAILHKVLPLEATDELGVINRFWPISDLKVIGEVTQAIAEQPVYIADGHHRYETGLRYLEDKRASGDVPNEEAAPNYIMMMLVGMSDPGLQILPTHRLVSGLPADLTGSQVRDILSAHFEVEEIGRGEAAANDLWELIQADGSQAVLGFGTVADGAWHLARFTDAAKMAELVPDRSTAWRELAVSVLHVLVLGKLFADHSSKCRYVHSMAEVHEDVAAKGCQLAALVPPATMEHVEEIAGAGEKMPAKSTYFYPKLLTGLVYNSLKGN